MPIDQPRDYGVPDKQLAGRSKSNNEFQTDLLFNVSNENIRVAVADLDASGLCFLASVFTL